ncbi:MAG: ATP-binding protein, partial [Anaerovorax sp.]
IRSAILNSGEKFPQKRITINLSPANARKEGSHFDLPMAMGILAALESVKTDKLSQFALIGELSLDGEVNGVRGVLPLVMGLRDKGIQHIMVPVSNIEEAGLVRDVNLYPIGHLREAISYFKNKTKNTPYIRKKKILEDKSHFHGDFTDVAGQESAKRCILIGACGSHGLLMVGPAGAGKTMISRLIPTILPHMTYEEQLEVTKIYSVAGALSQENPMILERPFRAPHHTITAAALIGGGRRPKPGEVSLAHSGVLFLDELPEFKRQTIDLLRQ